MKKIVSIQLDKVNGKTTLVTEVPDIEEIMLSTESGRQVPVGLSLTTKKEVITTQVVPGDKYDPYVGVALVMAYAKFGGKEKFRKYVNECAKVVGGKKLVNYDKMTIKELRSVAQGLGIKGYTKMHKSDLLAKIKEMTK